MTRKNLLIGAAAVAALVSAPLIAQIPVTDASVDASINAQLSPMNVEIGVINTSTGNLNRGLTLQPTPGVATTAAMTVAADADATQLASQYQLMMTGIPPVSGHGKIVKNSEDTGLTATETLGLALGNTPSLITQQEENTIADIIGRLANMNEISAKQNLDLDKTAVTLAALPDLKSVATYHAMLAALQIKATNRMTAALALVGGIESEDDLSAIRLKQAQEDDYKDEAKHFLSAAIPGVIAGGAAGFLAQLNTL